MDIYDRHGKPMELEEFQKIPARRRILKDKSLIVDKDRVLVRTMWEGVDAAGGDAPVPMIFSTYVWSENHPNMRLSTPDEHKALMAHEMMVGFVRAQGGKTGLPVFAQFMKNAFTSPRNLKLAYWNLGLMTAVCLIQLATLTGSLLMWNWDWSDLFTGVIGAAYGYATVQTARTIKRLRRQKREAERIEKDREEFERIVGQLSDRPD